MRVLKGPLLICYRGKLLNKPTHAESDQPINRIIASIPILQQHLDSLAGNPSIYRSMVCLHCSFGKLWCSGCYDRKGDQHPTTSESLNPIPFLDTYAWAAIRLVLDYPNVLLPDAGMTGLFNRRSYWCFWVAARCAGVRSSSVWIVALFAVGGMNCMSASQVRIVFTRSFFKTGAVGPSILRDFGGTVCRWCHWVRRLHGWIEIVCSSHDQLSLTGLGR